MTGWKILVLGGFAAMLAGPVPSALADPWKNESGHGRREQRYDRRSDHDNGRHRGDDRRWAEQRRREDARRWEQDRRRDYDRRRDNAYRNDGPRGPLSGPAEVLGQILGGR